MVTWRRWRRSRPLSNLKFICIFYHNFFIYLSNEYVQCHFLFRTIQFLHFYCLLGSNEFIANAVAAMHNAESALNLYQFRPTAAVTNSVRAIGHLFRALNLPLTTPRTHEAKPIGFLVNVMVTLLSMLAPSSVRQWPQLSIACIALPTKLFSD